MGSYYLTLKDDTELGSPREEDGHTVYRVYSSPTEAKLAYINKTVGLHAPIKVRVTKEYRRQDRERYNRRYCRKTDIQ